MKTRRALIALAVLIACGATAAQADTSITFDERASASTTQTGNFVSGGFQFSNAQDAGFLSWGLDDGTFPNFFNADPDGATVLNNSATLASFAQVGGAAFALKFIDIADIYNGRSGFSGGASTVRFTGSLAGGGTTVQDFTISGAAGLTTFAFGTNFANVVSVSWDSAAVGDTGHYDQLDNIVVGNAVTGGVPEPSMWALMILGFGALGVSLRRGRSMKCMAS